jgi:hypothetical protein
MSEVVICKQIKCKDCLTGEGDPAWCYRAGQPAEVAVQKCPKMIGEKPEEVAKGKTSNDN